MLPSSKIPYTVWLLGFVSLMMDISSEMVNTLLPLHLAAGLGASAAMIGLVEAVSVAVATATKLLAGAFVDLSGRAKPAVLLGYGLGAASRLVFPLAVNAEQVVLGKVLDRLGKGVRSAPRDAIIAAVSPPEIRGASFGLRKSLDALGGFLGPLLAVAAMLWLGGEITAVFWLAALPAALAVALLCALRPPAPAPSRKPAAQLFDRGEMAQAWGHLRGVFGLAGVILLARFSEAFVLLKALEAGVAAVFVPLLIALLHAVYALAAWPVGRLSDQLGPRGLLLCGMGALALAHLALGAAQTPPMLLAGVVLWGLHMGCTQGLLAAMVAAKAPAALRGSAFGLFTLLSGVVMGLGNLVAGGLWHSLGSAAPFWLGAGLSVLAMAVVARHSAPH